MFWQGCDVGSAAHRPGCVLSLRCFATSVQVWLDELHRQRGSAGGSWHRQGRL
jgi:hypothetical protein